MDTKSPDDLSLKSKKAAVDTHRRTFLGGATAGGIAVASVTAIALLRSERAEASGDPGGYYVYNAVTDFGATGNGSTNDTTALQNAINAASGLFPATGGILPLYIPPGIYKITTALTIPRYTKLFGAGRTFSTIIQPHSCGLFIIDGSLYSGSTVQGICISDLVGDLTNASATNAVYINDAYNIDIRDCFFNNSGSSVACNTLIQNSNDVVLDNVSICGNATTISSNALGLSVVGTGGDSCTAKLIAPDCEYFAVAIKTSGYAIVDMYSPYSESCLLNYYHGITAGHVNIHGGEMQGGTGAPYCVNIQADNLTIYGAWFQGYSTAVFEIAASPTFRNVKVFGYGYSGPPNSTLAAGSNLASVEFFPPLATVSRGTVDFTKTMTSGSSTHLLSLSTSEVMKCRLTIYAYVGAASCCAQYDFALGSGGFIPNIVSSASSANSNSNWAVAVASPQLTVVGSTYTFGLTATSGGALGSGSSVSLFGELDYVSYDFGASNVIETL